MPKRAFDLGLVVPLAEEYEYITEIAPQQESVAYEGTYFYRLDFGAASTICCIVGEMGPLAAMHAANRLLTFADLKLLVVLGLAGALGADVAVGDVVVAAEVSEFQANSKAESTETGYEIRYSGRNWPLSFPISEAVKHFAFSGGDAFQDWRNHVAADYETLEIPNKSEVCSALPSVFIGPIASGSIVAASGAFVEEIKRQNRKFLAIEMEAAGVAQAAANRIHPVQCVIIRGISDLATGEKKDLDQQGGGAWRRYCVRNAASFLHSILRWDGFLQATGLQNQNTDFGRGGIERQLVAALRSTTGGPWLVGVTFGLYTHGPHVLTEDSVVPLDVSRLRNVDGRAKETLDYASDVRAKLLDGGDLPNALTEFARLANEYEKGLGSSTATKMLADFDNVVVTLLVPSSGEEGGDAHALLLEADRLDEEAGPDAVIDLLRPFVTSDSMVRQRFVAALTDSGRWKDVIDTLIPLQSQSLSRKELEDLIYALAKTDSWGDAVKLLQRHAERYDDRAATLFRAALGPGDQEVPLRGSDQA